MALAGLGYADDMTVRLRNLLTPEATDYYHQMRQNLSERTMTPSQTAAVQNARRQLLMARRPSNINPTEPLEPLEHHPPYASNNQ